MARLASGCASLAPGPVLALTLAVLPAAGACGPDRGTIGAVLARSAEGGVRVVEVPEGLGAARAGVRPGDRILLVDGRDPRALSASELSRILGGEVGAPVRLTLERGAEVLRVTIHRTEPPGRSRRMPATEGRAP